jgi:membrane protein YqaA with SNARE-associated domain
MALLAWVPIIGDVIAVALGFYKIRPFWTIVLLLVGKFARFMVWNFIYGLF